MSAYVVENKTIDRILTGLDHMKHNQRHYPSSHYYQFLKEIHPEQNDLTKIGKKLLSTNIIAVCQRYQSESPKEYEQQLNSYSYRLRGCPSPIQFHKDLSCLIYQCSEGTVPENSQIYRDIETLKNAVANTYITNLDAYELAEWD